MFWLLALGVGAGTFAIVDAIMTPAGMAIIGGSIIATFATIGIVWIDDHTFISGMAVGSWKFLSGAKNPNDIYVTCSSQGTVSFQGLILNLFLILILLVLAFVVFVVGLASLIGVPVGALVVTAGAFGALGGNKDILVVGLKIFCGGMTCLIVTGVLMRIIHVSSGAMC